jgi:hypothetical protein
MKEEENIVQAELFSAAELEAANTPEKLGVTPRFVLQRHAVSRGTGLTREKEGLSSTAKKVTALAMALLPPDLSSLTASFTFSDFCRALGCERGGKSFKLFQDAIHECMSSTILIKSEQGGTGQGDWTEFRWFAVAHYDAAQERALLMFAPELAGFLSALKWMYAKLSLKDLGQLQSRYAIHLFEMAMSYRGTKRGQRASWDFRQGFPEEMRHVMAVPKDAYKSAHVLKQKVVDNPVKEINEAGLGITITPRTVKEGRRIVAIAFDCAAVPRKAGGKGRRKKNPDDAPALPEGPLRAEQELEEKELAHLAELYPEEFAERYEAALESSPDLFHTHGMERAASVFARNQAMLELKEAHGIVK